MTWALLSYADPTYLVRLEESAGPQGWGHPVARDSFADGSENPAGTPYAPANAVILQALLDAGQEPRDIAEAWNACCFSDGMWWYSTRPNDAIYTPNASALMAGVMQRLGYTAQADAAIRRLIESAHDGPSWDYSEKRQEPNDLLHHGFIVWSLEQYRRHGGTVEIPWTTAELAATLAGRTDTDWWPAAGPAFRYAFAACFGGEPDPTDLEHQSANPRDAAFITFAANVC